MQLLNRRNKVVWIGFLLAALTLLPGGTLSVVFAQDTTAQAPDSAQSTPPTTLAPVPVDTLVPVSSTPPATVPDSTAQTAADTTVPAEPSDVQPTPADTASKPVSRLPGSRMLEEAPDVQWSISASRVFWAFVVFMIGYLGIKYATKLLVFIAERRARSRLSIKAAIPILRISGWTFILYFIIARVFAPPIETVLALTASLGIAVGFAAQDILKNIFGGIMILFDRPFSVGDKIQIGDHYGEVLSIGLRTVRLVTPDDSEVSVPNAEVAAQSVSNANSGASDCQVVAEFFLTPNVDLTAVERVAVRAAQISRYTYLNKPVAVVMKNEMHEGRSLIKVRLKAYVFDHRYEFAHITDLSRIVMDELIQRKIVNPQELAMMRV